MERLNLKKLTEVEVGNSYEIKSRNRLAAVQNLDDSEDINLLTYSMEQSPSWEANWFCS